MHLDRWAAGKNVFHWIDTCIQLCTCLTCFLTNVAHFCTFFEMEPVRCIDLGDGGAGVNYIYCPSTVIWAGIQSLDFFGSLLNVSWLNCFSAHFNLYCQSVYPWEIQLREEKEGFLCLRARFINTYYLNFWFARACWEKITTPLAC